MNRRDLLSGCGGVAIAAAGVVSVAPAVALAAARPQDERFMRLALAEAAKGDFRFGAVIVRDGEVLARGFNSGKRHRDPTAHGEIVAIRACLAAHGPERLRDTTLYTSGEPCPMCIGAIVWCGISRVVFAASIPELATRIGQIMVSSAEIADKAPPPRLEITGGVLAAEALALFR